jgi:hypothetical protein
MRTRFTNSNISLGPTIIVLGLLALQSDGTPLVTNMNQMTSEKFMQESKTIVRQRRETIANLLNIVQDPKLRRSHGVDAVYALGKLRAIEAVPFLMNEMARDDRIEVMFTHDTERDQGGTCMRALISIGKPASVACLAALAGEKDAVRRNVLALVIRAVESADIAKIMIERQLARESEPERKANLNAVLNSWSTSFDILYRAPWVPREACIPPANATP